MGAHVVYRCFDDSGQLLYIGVTYSLRTRMKQHRMKSAWWSEVTRIETEEFAHRAAAFAAERQAIVAEQPIHNRRRNFLPPERIEIIRREPVEAVG